jgi:hypothetical protein
VKGGEDFSCTILSLHAHIEMHKQRQRRTNTYTHTHTHTHIHTQTHTSTHTRCETQNLNIHLTVSWGSIFLVVDGVRAVFLTFRALVVVDEGGTAFLCSLLLVPSHGTRA